MSSSLIDQTPHDFFLIYHACVTCLPSYILDKYTIRCYSQRDFKQKLFKFAFWSHSFLWNACMMYSMWYEGRCIGIWHWIPRSYNFIYCNASHSTSDPYITNILSIHNTLLISCFHIGIISIIILSELTCVECPQVWVVN